VLLVPYDLGVEPFLIQVPDAVVPLVEALGVDAVESVHAERDVGERSLDDQVEVVVHQAVRKATPVEPAHGVL